jgi:hypothetical protein
MTYITTYSSSGAHAFNVVWTALHTLQNIFTSYKSGHKTFLGLHTPEVHGHDSSHDGHATPTAQQGLFSSKPHLEGTGLDFTTPDVRILTFLP